jgi:hypothetical protein
MTGWNAGRTAGGISGQNRLSDRPIGMDKGLAGDGGLAYDPALKSVLSDKGKKDKGYYP